MSGRQQKHVVLLILADDYGDASRGLSFEYETFVPTFRRFFNRVTVFPQDRELRERGYFGAAKAFEELIEATRPDLIFCVPFENQIKWEAIRHITESGIPTVAWMSDDHWRWDNFSLYIAPSFSAVVTTDREAYAAYQALPGVVPILSQWGVDSGRLFGPGGTRSIQVSFVGARRPHRARMVAAVRRAGIQVTVRGTGWTEGRATTDELYGIPRASLIALNFSDSSQPHRRGRTQLKARPFELAASGCCVVTEPDPQLAAFYDVDRQVVVAEGPHQLIRTLRWLLADEPERMDRAYSAWRRTAKEHTYDVRLSRILSVLGFDLETLPVEGELCVTR